ncbi:MAG: DUF2125 domain-containing protein [Alphaproteobacteria bacterium]|nr:DUF2125 domain-containing protein [Alphaproteobacteria bacterium]
MRRGLVVFLLLVVVAVAAGTAFWFHAAGAFERGLERWADERRRAGGIVSWQTVAVGGFPLALEADIAAPRYGEGGAGRGWVWEGERIRARTSLWQRDRIDLVLPERSRLVAAGGSAALTTRAPTGIVQLDARGRTSDVALLLPEPRLDLPASVLAAREARIVLRPRAPDDKTLAGPLVLAAFDAVRLPAEPRPVLGPEIARLEVEAVVTGLDDASPPGTLEAWRSAGGTVEIRRLHMRWGPLDLAADGTLALDQALQPMGAATARIGGWREVIDHLAAGGAVPTRDAAMAKSALQLLARPTPEGGRSEIRVPLTVQASTLYLGPVKLLRVPPIAW